MNWRVYGPDVRRWTGKWMGRPALSIGKGFRNAGGWCVEWVADWLGEITAVLIIAIGLSLVVWFAVSHDQATPRVEVITVTTTTGRYECIMGEDDEAMSCNWTRPLSTPLPTLIPEQ